MAYYEDLSTYTYHNSAFYIPGTKNIGWLALGHDFPTATPTEQFLDYIWEFCKISVAQMRGVHECEFCHNIGSYYAERRGEKLLLGTSEIRVFSRDRIYAAPSLIYHYINFHRYSPPNEFVRAVLCGPRPPSSEYFQELRRSGLEWKQTSIPS
jgi:hypothetical protein